jgi:hypothetical protein
MAEALLRAIVALVRRNGADLSARQIGVFSDAAKGSLEQAVKTRRSVALGGVG